MIKINKKMRRRNAIGLTKKEFIGYFSIIIIFIMILFIIIIPIFQGNLFFLTVLSGSMQPDINAGDVVIVKSADPYEIKINDIITYKQINSDKQNQYVTHRVINISVKNNSFFYKTKGDANDYPDLYQVNENDIIGKKIFTIPQLGFLINFIHQPIGFFIFLIIPGFLIIGNEVKKIIKELRINIRRKKS